MIWQASDSSHDIVLLFDKCDETSVVGYSFFVKFFSLIICYGFSAKNVFLLMLEVSKDEVNCYVTLKYF
jgi:hypothetical protein